MANLLKVVSAAKKEDFLAVADNHFYSVVFIQDTKEIYTHGVYFGISPDDLSGINTLISNAQSAADTAKTTADGKVANVTGANAITVTSSGSADNSNISKAVALKINTTTSKGNVTLTQDTNGLKANIDLSSYANLVTGVASGEKVLSLNSKLLSTTLKVDYDSTSKKLQLKGIGDAVISELDATPFIKDGMLSSVTLETTKENGVTVDTPYLKFTFNTDSGQSIQRISMKDLVDVYDGANIKLTAAYSVPTSYTAPTSGDSMNVAIAKLTKGVALATGDGVTSFMAKTGAITANSGSTTNGAVNFAIDTNNKVTATVYGLGTAAYTASTAYATSAQGDYANTALQTISKGTDGTYVTTTIATKSGNNGAKTQKISVAVKTQAVSTATSSANGLAVALDVKSYVDGLLAWVEL